VFSAAYAATAELNIHPRLIISKNCFIIEQVKKVKKTPGKYEGVPIRYDVLLKNILLDLLYFRRKRKKPVPF